MRLTADSQADLERFVRRVAETDQVWALRSAQGMAVCQSLQEDDDDDKADEGPATVLLLFSDAAYARRVQRSRFPDHAPDAIALFDFMYRWLPGMSGDGALAGPNWSAALTGCEVDPFALRERIEAAMAPEHVERHLARYRSLTVA